MRVILKKALKFSMLIALIILAAAGIGLAGGVSFATYGKREDERSIKTEQVKGDELHAKNESNLHLE